jgi:hypothetical protein
VATSVNGIAGPELAVDPPGSPEQGNEDDWTAQSELICAELKLHCHPVAVGRELELAKNR